MKHTYFVACSVLAAVLFVLPGLAQIEAEITPEFYFTRLVYGNGLGPGRVPRMDFRCADLERGEGGSWFGGGWSTDFPASDCKFMWGIQRLSNIRVHDKSPHLITALDRCRPIGVLSEVALCSDVTVRVMLSCPKRNGKSRPRSSGFKIKVHTHRIQGQVEAHESGASFSVTSFSPPRPSPTRLNFLCSWNFLHSLRLLAKRRSQRRTPPFAAKNESLLACSQLIARTTNLDQRGKCVQNQG